MAYFMNNYRNYALVREQQGKDIKESLHYGNYIIYYNWNVSQEQNPIKAWKNQGYHKKWVKKKKMKQASISIIRFTAPFHISQFIVPLDKEVEAAYI